jgi:HAD superfamily hydrolase (TIGR01509 family)
MIVLVTARAVLLDSGGVLIRPISGSWFPPPAFELVLADRGIAWDRTGLEAGLEAGMAHLDGVHHIPLRDETDEAAVMTRYYEILLQAVGVEEALAADMVTVQRATLAVEPFAWTEPVLLALRARGCRVVIVSDAWPSLRSFYRRLRLDHLVDAMVISAEEGVTKPDPHMYVKALGLVGCSPDQAVFVDDWPPNVVAATALGIRAFRLRPGGDEPSPGVDELTDLRELLAHV